MNRLLALLLFAAIAPAREVIVSARPVRDLAAAGDTIWAATGGGLVEVDGDTVRIHTTLDGLPAVDLRQVLLLEGEPLAIGRTFAVRRAGSEWRSLASGHPILCAAAAAGRLYLGREHDVILLDSGQARVLPVPGTPRWLAVDEASAWLGTDAGLCRLEDGIWRPVDASAGPPNALGAVLRDGRPLVWGPTSLQGWDDGWEEVPVPWPAGAAHLADVAAGGHLALFGHGVIDSAGRLLQAEPEVTAISDDGRWLGTRDGRLVSPDRRIELPAPLPNNYVTSLASWRDRLWIGTLDGGIAFFDGRWRPCPVPLASPWIKQLVGFDDRLWVRHADGKLELFDGRTVTPVVAGEGLPRDWFSTLTVGGGRLWAGVWGGVAAYDGTWTTWLHQPELEGQVVTALAWWNGRLTVGTQGTGLLVGDPATGDWTRYDERAGLDDPWITSLAAAGDTLWIGTFNAGAYRLRTGDSSMLPVAELAADAQVTAMIEAPDSSVPLLGTGTGLWQGRRLREPLPDPAVTALAWHDGSLWVGTRAGLLRLGLDDLEQHRR